MNMNLLLLQELISISKIRFSYFVPNLNVDMINVWKKVFYLWNEFKIEFLVHFFVLFILEIISPIWSSFKFLSITNSKINEMWLNLSKLLSLFKMLCPSVIIKQLFVQIFKNICWTISVLPRKNRFYFPCGLVKLFHLCYVWHVSMMVHSIGFVFFPTHDDIDISSK